MGWKIMEIKRFQCETPVGEQEGSLFEDYKDAKAFAMQHGLRVIAYQYEITDSEMVDDFTGCDDESEEGDCDE